MPGSFFDTNVVVYLLSADAAKADVAERLVAGGGTISVQVVNEAANVARRKMKLGWPETRRFLRSLRGLFDVVPVTLEAHALGLDLAERHGLSTYDSAIAASAFLSGCEVLWSEDMHHGLQIGESLRIANPFRP